MDKKIHKISSDCSIFNLSDIKLWDINFWRKKEYAKIKHYILDKNNVNSIIDLIKSEFFVADKDKRIVFALNEENEILSFVFVKTFNTYKNEYSLYFYNLVVNPLISSKDFENEFLSKAILYESSNINGNLKIAFTYLDRNNSSLKKDLKKLGFEFTDINVFNLLSASIDVSKLKSKDNSEPGERE